jgi:uncharacterized protein (TIGR02145 family)
MKINKSIILFLLAGLIFLISCPKDEKEMLVRTGSATEILITTAKVSGEILDLGEGATNYGHCFATTPNPTIAGTKTEMDNPVLGKYTSTLTGLSASTTYYVRAFLSRGKEVVYGSDTIFTTASDSLPELTTSIVTGIGKTSAVSGGNITSQGGTPVTARGVCWSQAAIITLTNNKTNDGNGMGLFTSDITSLTPGTNYFVRAYATNSGGTKLGNEVTFSTTSDEPIPPTVTTAEVTSVTSNSAVCGGNVSSEGSSSVTARGICWHTSENPTILNYHTADGTGSGIFISNIPGGNPELTSGTLYHVRAYATNGAGISYGTPERIIITCKEPIATTNDATNILPSTATLNGVVNANSINDSITNVLFEYGITTSYGSSIPAIPRSLTGSGYSTVSANLTGLLSDTKYYFRVKAINCGGTTYGNELSFNTNPSDITDIDGNIYHIVRIGTQLWTKENLKTTKFNEGSVIPLVTDNTEWAGLFLSSAYCWYNNDESNKNIYGALYNWYAVWDSRLCPTGWHVPHIGNYTILTDYLGGEGVAGGKMKEIGLPHWYTPNAGATNESGFTALAGGLRDTIGEFHDLGLYGYFWSNTHPYLVFTCAFRWELHYSDAIIYHYCLDMRYGFSVRCIKD